MIKKLYRYYKLRNQRKLRRECINFIVRQSEAAGSHDHPFIIIQSAQQIEHYILTGKNIAG
jgi:hypothetical protein